MGSSKRREADTARLDFRGGLMLPNFWLLNPPVGGGRIDILILGRMDGTVVDLVAEETGLDCAMDGL